MSQLTSQKKPALGDWHWADVLAALRKRGWSLRQVGLAEGYAAGNTLGEAARRPWPKAEEILARYIGVSHPMVIWPTRYDARGIPNRKGRQPMVGSPPRKPTSTAAAGNPQKRGTA